MPYLGLIIMILWVFCLIDVITAEDTGVRHLPKMLWLLFVILIPLAGSVVWLLVGRPIGGGVWGGNGTQQGGWNGQGGRDGQGINSAYPEYETRPGRALGTSPEADEEFLRQCRARAEQQRKRAKGN
ncbi:PLD nuclease N-terminal domain-containing protein [Rhodococcus sp. G-MC3]|uniref:PLD nuclease N-terminal domain-containing protein n=1 Tax=Rhodococcus sp. G-MC3 TaxID=3046209 RepID=UPI0024BB10CC|nr:PLD nuclease N-terminal domain-containing protein [Rhodococcus sp. G-MC3]MDJ0394416.1 PLD nuclease N-terminal domain-containing protein [Rhodococcus sp. G-MC3]